MDGGNGHLREFGRFRLDIERKVLWCDSKAVFMPLKELEVLCLLVKNAGELVTKNQLMETVWADSFVEESNLSRHIYLLRKALKDLGGGRNLIENVPRRGYRFTGEVRVIESDEIIIERHAVTETLIEIENPDPPATVSRTPEKTKRPDISTLVAKPLSIRIAAAVAAILVIALIGGAAFLIHRNSRSSVAASHVKSLAVLPFRAIDSNRETGHQGLGLADVLITRLSSIRGLNVRPTSAVMSFENQEIDSIQAGHKLNVDSVLEGDIYRTGPEVRVTMRLLKVSDNTTIWSGEFEKPLKDELRLQNEIALQVVDALSLNLSSSEKSALSRRYTENIDAYQLYIKGRYEWNKRSPAGMIEAERLFRNAIENDPNFALPYIGVADTLAMRTEPVGGYLPAESYLLAEKALELDPSLGEAHATLGFLRMFHQWKWKEAEAELKKSIELSPGYATAHHWYGILLEIEGRNAEAKAELARALEINPLSYNFLADLGQVYYYNREYDKAKEYCLKALEIYPDFNFAHDYLYDIYLQTGDWSAAVEEKLKSDWINASHGNASKEQNERLEKYFAEAREKYRKGGLKQFLADSLLRDPTSFWYLAKIYAFLGQKEKALDNLEKTFESRAIFVMPFVKADPVFDGLRSEPRYQAILKKMDLN